MKRHFATVVEYRKYPFPDINPFPFLSTDYGRSIKLATYRFPAKTRIPKAVIVHFPGFTAIQPWYQYAANHFADAGYEFVGYDYKGHGGSEGLEHHVSSFEAHMNDVCSFTELIKYNYPGMPIVAAGHSFGGGSSIALALLQPELVDVLMLTAPVTQKPETMRYVRVCSALSRYFPFRRLYFPEKGVRENPLLQYSIEDKLFLNPFMDDRTMASYREFYGK